MSKKYPSNSKQLTKVCEEVESLQARLIELNKKLDESRSKNLAVVKERKYFEHGYTSIVGSRTWKYTKPLRKTSKLARVAKKGTS